MIGISLGDSFYGTDPDHSHRCFETFKFVDTHHGLDAPTQFGGEPMREQNARQNGITAKVYYQGLLFRIVGRRDECLALPKGSRLGGLITSLVGRYGADFERALLTPAGDLRPEVGILIDGLNPARRGGIGCPLAQDNSCAVEIALLGSPPVGG
jgi:hypothetical protein